MSPKESFSQDPTVYDVAVLLNRKEGSLNITHIDKNISTPYPKFSVVILVEQIALANDIIVQIKASESVDNMCFLFLM